MRFVYQKLCNFFYFYIKTILIPFFCHVSGISLTRGNEFRNYWPKGFESEEENSTYEWWRVKLLIDGFNAACKNISYSSLKVGDESMNAIRFWTIAKGGLPQLCYIFL